MKILVTGGSGHLGANLVRRLIADGHTVRCLVRAGSDNRGLDGLPVELAYGDLRDRPTLDAAVAGVDRIFHVAAKVSTVEHDSREVFESNVLGTRNLLAAAKRAGTGRVVVTGSFSAVGHRRGELSDESMPFDPFEKVMPYERSKVHVEHEVLKAVAEGQDVVIATSCSILGPNDFKPSRMGRVLCDVANGKMPAYIAGGFEFVATRDIVEGHVLAMEKGRTGQKYIISTQSMQIEELFDIYERVTQMPRPRWRLPATLMLGVAHVSQFVLSTFAPHRPQRFTPGAVRVLQMYRKANTKKAQEELGFRPTSIEDAIRDQYWFFVDLGWIKNPKGERPAKAAPAPTSTKSASPRTTAGDRA